LVEGIVLGSSDGEVHVGKAKKKQTSGKDHGGRQSTMASREKRATARRESAGFASFPVRKNRKGSLTKKHQNVDRKQKRHC